MDMIINIYIIINQQDLFYILKLIINTLFNKEMYQDKIAFKVLKNVKLDGIIKHLEYTHLEVKSLIQFI